MNCKTIAVLLTCHNRKEKTLESLQALFAQNLSSDFSLIVYLMDDGSTDGTSTAVSECYPGVKLFQGDGNLFWNGGMRYVFAKALEVGHDFYCWLNDDTMLYPDALQTLLDTYAKMVEQGYRQSIVAGSTQDAQSKEWSYGGYQQLGWFYPPFKGKPVIPNGTVQSCDLMCGNIVLIPTEVTDIVGNLDPELTHYAGDWDYGLRAKQHGCHLWIVPNYLGTCAQNPKPDPANNPNLQQGLKKIDRPKGLALQSVTLQPWSEWKLLMQRHGGLLWPIFWLLPYRKLILPRLFDRETT
ncbi:glycosyltransferase family 2 protein [Roseofilum casamattae]|uniref:Glycosyltransferase family 2 protein n=1 Tax=Roseofilum casamattae BLCC-M143 TaxID=3022442 RepID=A0ABT7BUM2_9CYAN|nr:glycosyltransferase family 2 protein [Roseofilum casamattae]MDJ1182892.1 glycosyltransferase family 2 protein [Roseofilum casamattae BLCC-M143]